MNESDPIDRWMPRIIALIVALGLAAMIVVLVGTGCARRVPPPVPPSTALPLSKVTDTVDSLHWTGCELSDSRRQPDRVWGDCRWWRGIQTDQAARGACIQGMFAMLEPFIRYCRSSNAPCSGTLTFLRAGVFVPSRTRFDCCGAYDDTVDGSVWVIGPTPGQTAGALYNLVQTGMEEVAYASTATVYARRRCAAHPAIKSDLELRNTLNLRIEVVNGVPECVEGALCRVYVNPPFNSAGDSLGQVNGDERLRLRSPEDAAAIHGTHTPHEANTRYWCARAACEWDLVTEARLARTATQVAACKVAIPRPTAGAVGAAHRVYEGLVTRARFPLEAEFRVERNFRVMKAFQPFFDTIENGNPKGYTTLEECKGRRKEDLHHGLWAAQQLAAGKDPFAWGKGREQDSAHSGTHHGAGDAQSGVQIFPCPGKTMQNCPKVTFRTYLTLP